MPKANKIKSDGLRLIASKPKSFKYSYVSIIAQYEIHVTGIFKVKSCCKNRFDYL